MKSLASIATTELSVQQIVFELCERETIKNIREETGLTHDEIWQATLGKATKRVYKALKKCLEKSVNRDEKDIALDALIYQKKCEKIFFPEYDDKASPAHYADKHGV